MQQSIIRRAKNLIKRKLLRRDKVKITRTGAWDGEVNHHFDRPLADALFQFFQTESSGDSVRIADFGSGSQALYTNDFREKGLDCVAYDGNKNILTDSKGSGKWVDLTETLDLGEVYNWILCLEVGEHIPKKFESTLIDNLHRHNSQGVVLSWALPNQTGRGHVNLQPNDYVIGCFSELGYQYDLETSTRFRKLSTLPWFKGTIMVFRKTS